MLLDRSVERAVSGKFKNEPLLFGEDAILPAEHFADDDLQVRLGPLHHRIDVDPTAMEDADSGATVLDGGLLEAKGPDSNNRQVVSTFGVDASLYQSFPAVGLHGLNLLQHLVEAGVLATRQVASEAADCGYETEPLTLQSNCP